MTHRRVFETPAGILLGPLELIMDGKARTFALDIDGAAFQGFIVRQGDRVHGYVDRCPHAGMTLAEEADDYLTSRGDFISCGWHGALFRIHDGYCIGGPCAGRSLTPWPVTVSGGRVFTA